MNKILNQEQFELLKYIAKEPNISQRGLSNILGISLGKLNYSIKQLLNKNLIEIHKKSSAHNKNQFLYSITAEGINAKKNFALDFLNENLSEINTNEIKKKIWYWS